MLKTISKAIWGSNKSPPSPPKESTKQKVLEDDFDNDEIQKLPAIIRRNCATNNLPIMEGSPKQQIPEVYHSHFIQKLPAVRRNSATTTVASSTTSASSSKTHSTLHSRTTSIPNSRTISPHVRRVSQNQRPLGVADMEIKSHCEQIKRIIGTSRLSQMNSTISTSTIILSSSDESVVYECFGSIVAIAQCTSSLEQGTLNDFLVTCDALRRKQPKYANKVSLLMSQAKAAIEALVELSDSDKQGTSAVIHPSTHIVSSNLSVLSPPSSSSSSSSSPSPVLSQHGTTSSTSDFLQEILRQYEFARACESNLTDISPGVPSPTATLMGVNDTALPVSVVRSGPPPIQTTTVRSGPPPIQVTTVSPVSTTVLMGVNDSVSPPPPPPPASLVPVVRSAPPPIQVTTVRTAPPPIQVTTVRSAPHHIQVTTVRPVTNHNR